LVRLGAGRSQVQILSPRLNLLEIANNYLTGHWARSMSGSNFADGRETGASRHGVVSGPSSAPDRLGVCARPRVDLRVDREQGSRPTRSRPPVVGACAPTRSRGRREHVTSTAIPESDGPQRAFLQCRGPCALLHAGELPDRHPERVSGVGGVLRDVRAPAVTRAAVLRARQTGTFPPKA
jgi:hypothetical protein